MSSGATSDTKLLVNPNEASGSARAPGLITPTSFAGIRQIRNTGITRLVRFLLLSRVQAGGAFRLIYVARFAEAVYVLHAFQKKSRKTAKLDIELARRRLRTLLAERRQT